MKVLVAFCYGSDASRGVRREVRIALHVEGCLGGFILPFGEALGYDIPPFDFRLRKYKSRGASARAKAAS